MLPIRLVIEAFGPYLDRQTVDFTQFADKFLIWGETGAGKTVLLDAMTAALYNHASAQERGDIKDMRCQLAPADKETLVEFTFSVRGRVYRFWKKLRAIKRRKAGAEEDYNMECGALELLEGGEERNLMESSKAREQEAVAERIVGMGYHQFVQVMVLPQGKFERFLTADSAEKEKILKNIFRTDRFNAYQESLGRMFRAMDADVRQMEGALSAKLNLYGAADAQALEEQLKVDREELGALETLAQTAKEAFERANAQAAAAQALEDAFVRHDRSVLALAALRDEEAPVRRAEQAIQLSERARLVQPELTERDRLARENSAAKQRTETAQLALAKARQERSAAAEMLHSCVMEKEENERRQAEYTAAQQRLPELAALDKAMRTHAAAEQAMTPLEKREAELAQRAEDLRKVTEAQREQLAELEKNAAGLAEKQRLCERYAQAKRQLQRITALEEQLAQAIAAHKRAEELLKAANHRAADALAQEAERQNQYFSNAAHELSKRLEDGKPCPVCGSLHHPDVHISAAYEDARNAFLRARELSRKVQKELTDAAAACEGAQQRVNGLMEQRTAAVAEAKSLMEYDAQAEKEAQSACARMEAAAKEAEKVKEALERSAKNAQVLEQQRADNRSALAEAQAALAAAKAVLQQAQQRVGDVQETASQLQARILQLKKELDDYEARMKAAQERDHAADVQLQLSSSALAEAQVRLEQLSAALDHAQAAWKGALEKQGFACEEECRAALLPQEETERMRMQVQAHAQKLAAAIAEEEAAQSAVAGKERPDVQAAAAQRQESQDKWNDALAQEGTKRALVTEKQKLLTGVRQEGEKVLRMRMTRDKMKTFTESFTYAKGVTLSSFVLSAMLGTVAEQANRLLSLVHGGRYRLSIKKAATKAKLDGLELAVHDAYTGLERDVRTLSGGEKFLVSLSLSLGLSAVVRAQAGGISMEAMFIDEGFGTLDPRSIKDALDVLTCIGSGSRVGIISHVDVLRENILQGIEVVKSERGSRVVVRT